jgi:S-adenosylmethionine/arginine decarboxylase-like enzyme
MARLELSDGDASTLKEILSETLSELRYEISNTDAHDYREKLRLKQGVLERVIGQLGG